MSLFSAERSSQFIKGGYGLSRILAVQASCTLVVKTHSFKNIWSAKTLGKFSGLTVIQSLGSLNQAGPTQKGLCVCRSTGFE